MMCLPALFRSLVLLPGVIAFLPVPSHADFAPASGRGLAAEIEVLSGSGFLASTGNAVLYTNLEGNTFTLLGDANISNGYGTYVWTKTGPNTVDFLVDDQESGIALTYRLTFFDEDGGTYTVNAPGIGTQSGIFSGYLIVRPSEAANALGIGQPTIRAQDGNVVLELRMVGSDRLQDWVLQPGSVWTDGLGTIRFTAPVDTSKRFFRVEAVVPD